MSSSALFASSAGRSHSKNLVEFKAGKMTMKGKMVHPDKRKGLLYVYQSEDSLMHFCWKDRVAGSVEDDLIIFPDDCEFKRVDACTTGRVYVLKFKSSSRKLFFWLQEPKTDKDEEHCKKVNEMLNSPPTAGASRSGGGTPDELQNLLGSMSQQQLMQLFGTFGPGGAGAVQLPSTLSSLLGTMNRSGNNGSSTPASGSSSARTSATDKASTPTPSDSAKKSTSSSGSSSSSKPVTSAAPSTPQPTILLSDLQRYLNNIRPVSTPGTPSVEVDLSDALLNAESIQGVLNDPNLVQELSPHLPDVSSDLADPERLRSTLLSPQFQQGNMEEFVKALEKANITPEKSDGSSSSEQKSDSKEKKEESNDGDEKMNED